MPAFHIARGGLDKSVSDPIVGATTQHQHHNAMERSEMLAIKLEKKKRESCSDGVLRNELQGKLWVDASPQNIAIHELLADREKGRRRDSLAATERQHQERQRLAWTVAAVSAALALASAVAGWATYFAGRSRLAQFDQRLNGLEQRFDADSKYLQMRATAPVPPQQPSSLVEPSPTNVPTSPTPPVQETSTPKQQ